MYAFRASIAGLDFGVAYHGPVNASDVTDQSLGPVQICKPPARPSPVIQVIFFAQDTTAQCCLILIVDYLISPSTQYDLFYSNESFGVGLVGLEERGI